MRRLVANGTITRMVIETALYNDSMLYKWWEKRPRPSSKKLESPSVKQYAYRHTINAISKTCQNEMIECTERWAALIGKCAYLHFRWFLLFFLIKYSLWFFWYECVVKRQLEWSFILYVTISVHFGETNLQLSKMNINIHCEYKTKFRI